VKWQEDRPFDAHDLARLLVHRSQLPGADETTPLVVVSRTEATVDGITLVDPESLVDAFR
jgi:hypothetical protein